MANKNLNREDAIKMLSENASGSVKINQAAAASILKKSRQRIKQLVEHPEHSKALGVEIVDGKIFLDLKSVLEFTGRDNYRGKRGPQRKAKTNTAISYATM